MGGGRTETDVKLSSTQMAGLNSLWVIFLYIEEGKGHAFVIMWKKCGILMVQGVDWVNLSGYVQSTQSKDIFSSFVCSSFEILPWKLSTILSKFS